MTKNAKVTLNKEIYLKHLDVNLVCLNVFFLDFNIITHLINYLYKAQ